MRTSRTEVRLFTIHLREAIALNRRRAPRYAEVSGGRSQALSGLLIAMEASTLPVAAWFDRRSAPFVADGVDVVAEDFVSMDGVRPWHAPPARRRVAGRRAHRRVAEHLDLARRDAARRAVAGDFAGVRDAAAVALRGVRAVEDGEGAHFAMAAHLVESLGFCADNARRRGAGPADVVARDLVLAQALGLALAAPVDRLAQPLHRRGVGIVVNDVPDIPFRGDCEPAGAPVRCR